jgi:hypothetical protein
MWSSHHSLSTGSYNYSSSSSDTLYDDLDEYGHPLKSSADRPPKRAKRSLLRSFFSRESHHPQAVIPGPDNTQLNSFKNDMINATSQVSRDSYGRKLPWLAVEDRFDAAFTGGIYNYHGRAYPYCVQFSKKAMNGHLLAIGCEKGDVTLVDTSTIQGLDGQWKCKIIWRF